jgi:hypothetical protein
MNGVMQWFYSFKLMVSVYNLPDGGDDGIKSHPY